MRSEAKGLRFLMLVCLGLVMLMGAGAEVWGAKDAKDECLAIKGTLIDGTGAAPVRDGVVLVKNSRIIAVGQANKIKIPGNARVVSIPDAYVLPGFINTHVHSRYREDLLKKWASEGVTTVRDVGGEIKLDWFKLRKAFSANPACARLIAAGPILAAPGGMPEPVTLGITSPEQGRREVNKLIDRGADVIKIALNSSLKPLLSKEEVKAIIDAAHKRGKPVAAHIIAASAMRLVFRAGVDDINHLAIKGKQPDGFIKKFAASGIYWVPTLATMPPKFRAKGIDAFKTFVKLGGKVAMGNDSGWLPNVLVGMPMKELAQMQNAGMTPMAIIKASTLNAAIVCRIDKQLGTLEKEKIADILVIKGSPLTDINNLKNTRLVVLNGKVIVDKR